MRPASPWPPAPTRSPARPAPWPPTTTVRNRRGRRAEITKADPDCTVDGYTGAYDGDPHGASGSCAGVNDEGPLAGLDLGQSFTNVPGGTANWSFTDQSGNYSNDDGSVAIEISKADPDCTVDGYSGAYDGDPHGASGSCAGVNDEGPLAGLDLGQSFTNVPGGTANWSFTDQSGNYSDDDGSVARSRSQRRRSRSTPTTSPRTTARQIRPSPTS